MVKIFLRAKDRFAIINVLSSNQTLTCDEKNISLHSRKLDINDDVDLI